MRCQDVCADNDQSHKEPEVTCRSQSVRHLFGWSHLPKSAVLSIGNRIILWRRSLAVMTITDALLVLLTGRRTANMSSGAPFVHIIESPAPEDLVEDRCEGGILGEALRIAGMQHVYSLAVNRDMFVHSITNRLLGAVMKSQSTPILHVSAHGNVEGIALTSGEQITWRRLADLARPLANALEGNLIVCLSACNGAAGCRMAMEPGNGHTFGVLVSNITEVSWADAAVAYVAFYHRLFRGSSVAEAREAMKFASGDQNFAWLLGSVVKDEWNRWISDSQELVVRAVQEALRADVEKASGS